MYQYLGNALCYSLNRQPTRGHQLETMTEESAYRTIVVVFTAMTCILAAGEITGALPLFLGLPLSPRCSAAVLVSNPHLAESYDPAYDLVPWFICSCGTG
jgi:hypothetical protein